MTDKKKTASKKKASKKKAAKTKKRVAKKKEKAATPKKKTAVKKPKREFNDRQHTPLMPSPLPADENIMPLPYPTAPVTEED